MNGKTLAHAVNVALGAMERAQREAGNAMIALDTKPHPERLAALDAIDRYATALDNASYAVSELSHYSREILEAGQKLEVVV